MSRRRACRAVGISRMVMRYVPKVRAGDLELTRRMREPAGARRRLGLKMLHGMLRREGWVVNHTRSERISRREGLQVLKRRGRKQPTVPRMKLPAPTRTNEVLTMDLKTRSFVSA